MKLKHLKLFENFNESTSGGSVPTDMIFDWLPKTAMENDPIQNTIPQSFPNIGDLSKFVSGLADPSLVENAGYYIGFEKGSSGLTMVVATSLSPLSFNIKEFDNNFDLKFETKDVLPDQMGDLKNTTGMLAGWGISNIK
jgi:hypothetical protein